MEESLYFSDIETDEISLQVNEPLNTIISTEDSKNEIEQVIAVEEQYLTSHISPLNSDNKPKRELPKTSSIGSLYKDIHQEVVTAKDENKLELSPENVVVIWNEFLATKNVPAMIYYPLPLHHQKAYTDERFKDEDFAVTLVLCKNVISLPMHTELDESTLQYITECVLEFCK